jgi:hypothetical protein
MEFRRRPDLAASKEADSLSNFWMEAVMSRESQMLADFQPCARLQHVSSDRRSNAQQISAESQSHYVRGVPFSRAALSGVPCSLGDGRGSMVRVDVPSLRRIVVILGSEAYLLHRSPFANEYPQKERLDEAP